MFDAEKLARATRLIALVLAPFLFSIGQAAAQNCPSLIDAYNSAVEEANDALDEFADQEAKGVYRCDLVRRNISATKRMRSVRQQQLLAACTAYQAMSLEEIDDEIRDTERVLEQCEFAREALGYLQAAEAAKRLALQEPKYWNWDAVEGAYRNAALAFAKADLPERERAAAAEADKARDVMRQLENPSARRPSPQPSRCEEGRQQREALVRQGADEDDLEELDTALRNMGCG